MEAMLKTAQDLEEIWLPEWFEKEVTVLANHKGVDVEGLLVAAAILGWKGNSHKGVKDMSAEEIFAVLEDAMLKDVELK